jgi:hydroxyacylglutathione hydrolase
MTEIQQIDLGMVNAYLIKTGEDFILIDSGVPQLWKPLNEALKTAGCRPKNLKWLIFTHGDVDHTGNALRVKKAYGTKIAIHAGDVPMLRDGALVKRQTRGVINKMILRISERKGGSPDLVTPDRLLEDKQRLDEFGLQAVVLHTPGHTAGSIAILSDDGHLIVGDTIGNWRKPALAGLFEDKVQMQASLEKLKQTHAKIVYPGHGKPFPFSALCSIKS